MVMPFFSSGTNRLFVTVCSFAHVTTLNSDVTSLGVYLHITAGSYKSRLKVSKNENFRGHKVTL